MHSDLSVYKGWGSSTFPNPLYLIDHPLSDSISLIQYAQNDINMFNFLINHISYILLIL